MNLNKSINPDQVLKTIEDLVRFRTIDGAFDEFEKIVKYCEDFFADSDVIIKKYNYSGYPALVFLSTENQNPEFMLQGHLDVVDGDDSQFQPECKDEYLYGRGTVDMKGFDAIAMYLIKYFRKNHPEIPIGLMLTFDEEIGGVNGAAKLAKESYLPEILINGDGGYNHSVINAEKGILKIKIQVKTESTRHHYPWNGQNAFDLLLDDYFRITSLFKNHSKATDLDNWYTTYSSYDVYVENDQLYAPHFAEMKVNIYFTENILVDQLFQKIKNELKHAQAEKLMTAERVYLEPDNKRIIILKEKMQRYFKQTINVHSDNGSSDARFFTNKGVEIIIVKMVGEGHHTPMERLHIPSIIPMYNSLKDFIVETKRNSLVFKNKLLNV